MNNFIRLENGVIKTVDNLINPQVGVFTTEEWKVRTAPGLPAANPAAELLSTAKQPVIMVGGGAINVGGQLTAIAEHLDAAVIPSNAAKGIVPDSHKLNLGATVWKAPTLDHLSSADVILAVGTELGSDSYMPHLPMNGAVIRIDIDPTKINDHYPAAVGIVSDAASALPLLMDQLADIGKVIIRPNLHDQLAEIKQASAAPSNSVQKQHLKVLDSVRAATDDDGVLIGDMTQVIYSGSFGWQAEKSRQWHYAGAWCTLGCAMPMAKKSSNTLCTNSRGKICILAGRNYGPPSLHDRRSQRGRQ